LIDTNKEKALRKGRLFSVALDGHFGVVPLKPRRPLCVGRQLPPPSIGKLS
jgi:hypothetical protein